MINQKKFVGTSFFLLITILICCFNNLLLVYAQDNGINIPYTNKIESIPDIIGENESLEYSKRLKADEKDLFTFVFKNKDGSKTLRSFEHPVKYVNKEGKVKDISLKIKKNKDGSMSSDEHFVEVSFGNELSQGITVDYKKTKIKMKPVKKKTSNANISKDNKIVSYNIDNNTIFNYSLTYLGIKEDIVVKEYTGQTHYDFIMDTNGLHPVRIDESVYLADENDNIKATIGDIIIITADEKNNTIGKLDFETIIKNKQYRFTIILDPEYLKNKNTLYPITIDPTIEINYDNKGENAIEDVTINSLNGSIGTSGSLYVGDRDGYGISRVLMKFPGLNLESLTSADDIVSAEVKIRDLLCESNSMPVYCYIFNGNKWSESSATWDLVSPNGIGAFLDSNIVSYNKGNTLSPKHLYSFDITKAVKNWKLGTSSTEKGIIFKTSDTIEKAGNNNFKTFASYNRTVNKPSLTVVYKSNLKIKTTEISVKEGGTCSLASQIIPSKKNITWSSSNNSIAKVDTNGIVKGVRAGKAIITASLKDTDGSVTKASCTVYVYIENGVYYLKNKNSKYYLNVKRGMIDSKTDVCQNKYCSDSQTVKRISQMWKICYIGSGRYSIRPYNKLDMGLDVTNGNVDIFKTDTKDTLSSIPEDREWSITWNTNGYIFKNNDEDKLTMQVKNASKAEGATVIATSYKNNANCRWNIIKVTNVPSGVYWYDTFKKEPITSRIADNRYIMYNNTNSLSDIGLIAIAYSENNNSQLFSWTSMNTGLVIANSFTGNINGKKSGKTTIKANININGKYENLYYRIVIIGKEQYKAGVRISKYDNEQYYDFTIPINKLFRKAVDQCKEHRCMNFNQYCEWKKEISIFLEPDIVEWRSMQLGSFLWFYKQVNHNAVWDIKRENRWKEALPNVPYLKNGNEFGTFVFRGEKTTAEDIGNIMYGYTGRSMGFGKKTLFWGGGVANKGSVTDDALKIPPTYGDDENDHVYINQGYDYFCSDYPAYPEIGYGEIPLTGWVAQIADIILHPGT